MITKLRIIRKVLIHMSTFTKKSFVCIKIICMYKKSFVCIKNDHKKFLEVSIADEYVSSYSKFRFHVLNFKYMHFICMCKFLYA